MKAIEINSHTDKEGKLKIEYQLDKSNQNVRVILLVDEDDTKKYEKDWLKYISNNPAFDFLKEPEEDIYSPDDGVDFDD